MCKIFFFAALLLLCYCEVPPKEAVATGGSSRVIVSEESQPAVLFLAALDAEQRAKAQLELDDASRERWHFFPAAMWQRPGIALFELSTKQEELLFDLLRHSMSKSGYETAQQIISLEEVLAEMYQDTDFRDPEKYFAAFYGDPATDTVWAWSFEGHHLSLNFTIVGDQIAMTPRFLGANPATIQQGPRRGERTLAQEQDLALRFIQALPAEQQQIAIFRQTAFRDIVTGHDTRVSPLETVGIAMRDLSAAQQAQVKAIIDLYLSRMPSELARNRLTKMEQEEFADIRFGWAGATEAGQGHYYRIQGKSFLIEYDNTQNNANHIHTVWRDFDGDFGRDLLREHYERSGHR